VKESEARFDFDESQIRDDQKPALDRVGEILAEWPELRLEVGGHTDNIGTPEYNVELGRRRADAVVGYLRDRFPGIGANQLTVKTFGETRPIADNSTDEGRARNRRVEFRVLNTGAIKREIQRRLNGD